MGCSPPTKVIGRTIDDVFVVAVAVQLSVLSNACVSFFDSYLSLWIQDDDLKILKNHYVDTRGRGALKKIEGVHRKKERSLSICGSYFIFTVNTCLSLRLLHHRLKTCLPVCFRLCWNRKHLVL